MVFFAGFRFFKMELFQAIKTRYLQTTFTESS